MINQNYIKTTKTARYCTLGKPNKSLTNIWLVFHGYGQLANEFLLDFENDHDANTMFVAPEGMNKFYIRGFSEKIGAAWMTKEDRENEINDYVNMINNVYSEICEIVDMTKININILGFSQGGHTAMRWLNEKQPKVNKLILWGSGIPRDISYKENKVYWNKISIKLLIGNKDQFISKEKLNEELTFIKEQKLDCELINYNGSHKIEPSLLKSLLNKDF